MRGSRTGDSLSNCVLVLRRDGRQCFLGTLAISQGIDRGTESKPLGRRPPADAAIPGAGGLAEASTGHETYFRARGWRGNGGTG
jgi:hypothetical protein